MHLVTGPTAEAPATERGANRSRGISMATRLAAAVLLVSLASLTVATLVGINSGFDLGRKIYQAQLTSLGNAGALDVAGRLTAIRSATEARALSPAAADTLVRFDRAFDELAVDDLDTASAIADLTNAYEPVYLTPAGPTGPRVPIAELLPRDPRALYLQREYSVEVVDTETGDLVADDLAAEGQTVEVRVSSEPGNIDDAGDGSTWTSVHELAQPAYRRTVDELRFIDLYLIEPDDARIVYSVEKRPDLGTSLVTGPFGGSVLANAVNQVIDDPDAGTVMSDLSRYDAAPGDIVGVVATPVIEGDELVGVVAVMYDGAQFTSILTAGDAPAVGDSSEPIDVYLVGADGTLRSDPRTFLVDPESFLDRSEASGLISPGERAIIDASGTTVLTQPAVGATEVAAEDGDTSVAERPSMTGTTVISTVGAVPFDGLEWYVASEVGPEAAEVSLDSFRSILVVGASIFVIVIAFFAVAWANRIMQPVRAVSERLGAGDQSREPLDLREQSPVEMHLLAASYDSMASTLDQQQVALAVAREERLELLRQMLPTAVAERLAKGEADRLDRVPQATVVVLVVRGLGALVRERSASDNRDLLDRLHSGLDELAEQHGLDRIKVVGDAYFGACGHDRPFIDHAPRVVGFATDARDAVQELGAAASTDLDVAVGIDTGPVSVGMTGGSRLVYDVWGTTVNVAHSLARRAGSGAIVISNATHSMLPEEIPSEPGDVEGTTVWTVSATAMGSLGGPT